MYYICITIINQLTLTIMENLKVMEAAYNFTDAVIENKEYFIEKGCGKDTYLVKTAVSENHKASALMAVVDYMKHQKKFNLREVLPLRENVRDIILQEVQKFHEEQERKAREEEQLKEQFNEWRKNNGK